MKDTKSKKQSAFSRLSKVNKEKTWFAKKVLPLLIGASGLFMIVMMLRTNHSDKIKQEVIHQQKVEVATSLLKERLEDLKKEKQVHSQEVTSTNIRSISTPYSKELIARMNAPTSVYEGGNNNISFSSTSNGITSKVVEKNIPEASFMGKGANQDFANTNYQTSSVSAQQIPHPEFTIVSGEMLHAVLNVAMDSDLPGMVTATVTSPAYAYTGSEELIPKGSRLIGQYSSAVLQGQSRIFIMWNRLVLPDGVSVDINSPDTDAIGKAGEPADYINRRFWSRFGESVLLSILGAGVSNVDVQASDQYNSSQAYRIAIAESLQESASGTLQQSISLQPTLVRYQGATINVFIAHDLSFYDLYKQQGRA